MEIKDIVQEYASAATAEQTTEAQQESSLETTSQAPPQESVNESAYEALLTGKSNIKTEQEPVVTETQTEVSNNTESNVVEETSTEPVVITEVNVGEPVTEDASQPIIDDVVDEDDFIKTKTSGEFESWEQILEVINQPAKPKFENEMSETIYNLLLEGKVDDVVEALSTKKFAEEIKDAGDEEVLKAYIKVNNPEFDDEDVEMEFEEKYKIDEYAFDETRLKREQKKLSQRIKSDVLSAKEFFDSLAQEVVLPELSKQEVVQEPDTELENLIQEQRSIFLQSLNGVESRINSLPFTWKDEKANVSVNGKFDIPAQELSRYREAATDLETHNVNRYYKDGKYDGDKLVRDMYVADNFDKILTSAISQAVNQTRLEMLKQSKNIQSEQDASGTFRPSAAEEESALLSQLFMGHLKR